MSGFSLSALPGQSVVPTGVILTNRLGDIGVVRPLSGWTLDGSFMVSDQVNISIPFPLMLNRFGKQVFRKLQQLVPEFNNYATANAVQNAAGNY